jgi:hypothetical protein
MKTIIIAIRPEIILSQINLGERITIEALLGDYGRLI